MKAFQVERLSESARLPLRATPFAAGLDIFAAHGGCISALGMVICQTDIRLENLDEKNFYFKVAPRSGLTLKHSIDIGTNVLDSESCRNISIVMYNFSKVDFVFNPSDRIAQLIIQHLRSVECEVIICDELPETVRGLKGFGSTGLGVHDGNDKKEKNAPSNQIISQLIQTNQLTSSEQIQKSTLFVKKLSSLSKVPFKETNLSPGFLLCSAYDGIIPARGMALFKTDIAIAIPSNTYARIAILNELTLKHRLDVGAGVVDYDYRGNVGVILFNHSDIDYEVKSGDRIAQLILEQISMLPVTEVTDLPDTIRGESGFGSSGSNLISKENFTPNAPENLPTKKVKVDEDTKTNAPNIDGNCEISALMVKRLTNLAHLPSKGSEFAAGYDLSSAYDGIIPARGMALFKTDITIAIPSNTYARIAPRSGLTLKHRLDVGAGVVDYDYRGNVGVILFNHSDIDYEVKSGDRIAQLILEQISMLPLLEINNHPDFSINQTK